MVLDQNCAYVPALRLGSVQPARFVMAAQAATHDKFP